MGFLKRFNLRKVLAETGICKLVETGTGQGFSVEWALRCGFSAIESVELDARLHQFCLNRFRNRAEVSLFHGTSREFLAKMDVGAAPALYFLDAHFAGGADFGLISHTESASHAESFPLIAELDALLPRMHQASIVIVDDLRLYLDGNYQNGSVPEQLMRHDDGIDLTNRLQHLSSHQAVAFSEDEGYLVIAPRNTLQHIGQWRNLLSHDVLPSPDIELGIPGVTSIAMQRRLADHRYGNRYFVGYGIDVGGRRDPLLAFKEFLPRCQNIVPYDIREGSAQLLENVADESFDFLYSSHCLEHLENPVQALENWIRVVCPSGYLIINVPDEDLYEQGIWPSRFSTDHKWSFTIMKLRSWSPASINLLPLLMRLTATVEILSIARMDHGFRALLGQHKLDQTKTPLAECSIEIILRKL